MASKKKKPNRDPIAVLKAPITPITAPPSPPPSTGDARRDQLLRSIDSAQKALDRESASGFGDRSKNAADHLARLNKELKDYDSSQNYAERGYKLAVNVGAPVLGMVAGHKLANRLQTKHVAAVQSRNKELGKLASKADRVLAKPRITPAGKNKLRALVQTAEHLGLGKLKGPVGVATAGLLLTEGLISRSILAPQVDNEYAKEALRSVGTASVFAATSLVGERVIQNATQKTLPTAASLASINEARLAAEKTPRAAGKSHRLALATSKGNLASKVLRLVGRGALRVATPAVVGFAAAAAYSSSVRAGESRVTATAKGGAAALDAFAMNIPSSANAALKDRGHGSVPQFISSTVMQALNRPKPASSAPRVQAATRLASPIAHIASAGRTQPSGGVTRTKVTAHVKQSHGKGIFTRAHVRIVPR